VQFGVKGEVIAEHGPVGHVRHTRQKTAHAMRREICRSSRRVGKRAASVGIVKVARICLLDSQASVRLQRALARQTEPVNE
jgi:hypothetical protein